MLGFPSLDSFKQELFQSCSDRHSNVINRKFYEELGRRWTAISMNFADSKMKIDPDKVAYGIKHQGILMWPLGRVVLQRSETQKFRVVSNLSTERLFDELYLEDFISEFLTVSEKNEFLHSLETETGNLEEHMDWWERNVQIRDDQDWVCLLLEPFKPLLGYWFAIRTEMFPENDFFAVSLSIATKITHHSDRFCLENHPFLKGLDGLEAFDIENPDDLDIDDNLWLESVQAIPHLLSFWFRPPAGEEIELFL